MSKHAGTFGPVTPTERDVAVAKASSRKLSRLLNWADEFRLQPNRPGRPWQRVVLPPPVVRLIMEILAQMAMGKSITLTPVDAELTTQEAADLLGVSRPSMVRMLEDGDLPFTKVGTHRRVRFSDLMRFKERTAPPSERTAE